MPQYLIRGSYTAESWAAMIKEPRNRLDQVAPVVEGMGGTIKAAYLAFGEDDIVLIVEMPDNVSAAALSIAASAGGGVTHLTTTPLFTFEEGMDAAQRAGGSGYRPPQAS